jgi:hypothetical protein
MRREDVIEGVACALHWILWGVAVLFIIVAGTLSGLLAGVAWTWLFASCGA